jgi:hypothetical protein
MDATIGQLWPDEAKKRMKEKGISKKELRKLFSKVVFPWNPTYSSYRFFFQLEISELPLFVIVLPPGVRKDKSSSATISAASASAAGEQATKLLDYITRKNLTLRVINGRHSSAIQNPDVYADISSLNRCAGPKDRKDGKKLITVQAGGTQGQVYEYLFSRQQKEDEKNHGESNNNTTTTNGQSQAYHFAGGKLTHPLLSLALHPLAADDGELEFPGGSASSVSVPGITGCGGVGTLKRTFGLTVDSVTSFKIALPPTETFLPAGKAQPKTDNFLSSRKVESKSMKEVKAQPKTDNFLSSRKVESKSMKEVKAQPKTREGKDEKKVKNIKGSRVVTASATKNPNLFWALRGGQVANFGIVLKSIYVVHPINLTIRYSISFDWTPEKAKQVLKLWQKTAPKRPNEFNEDLSLFSSLTAVPARGSAKESKEFKQDFGISVGGVYVVGNEVNGLVKETREEKKKKGNKKKKQLSLEQQAQDDVAKVREELNSLIRLGGATVKIVVETYAETMTALTNARVYKPFSSAKIVFSRRSVDPNFVISKLIEAADTNLPGLHLFGIELMGGKISEVGSTETAFVSRQSKFMYDIFSYWDSALDTCANTSWVSSIFHHIYRPSRPRKDGSDHGDHVYVGFPINNLPNHLDAYYGENKTRLQLVKDEVDPLTVLHFPTGIKQ